MQMLPAYEPPTSCGDTALTSALKPELMRALHVADILTVRCNIAACELECMLKP